MIYTAICGGWNPPRSDIQCFTNSGPFYERNPRMGAKIYKILPNLFFPEAPVTVWVDGNIVPLVPEDKIVSELLPGESNVGCFTHPWRPDIAHEIAECILQSKITLEQANDLKSFLGDSVKLPLCECGILVRKNTPEVNHFNAVWWSLCCRFPPRDQLTFPYAIASVRGIRLNVTMCNLREHSMFKF